MLADISLFERLSKLPAVIFNSDAAGMMMNFDQIKKSISLCDRYIAEMQGEDFIPAEMISEMYGMRERFDNELLKLKGQLVSQSSREPLDNYDRRTFFSLSEEAKEELADIIKSDEITRRALEMQDAQDILLPIEEDKKSATSSDNAVPEKVRQRSMDSKSVVKDSDGVSLEETPNNNGEITPDQDNDLGRDVSSVE